MPSESPEAESPLERARRRLYAAGTPAEQTAPPALSSRVQGVPTGWEAAPQRPKPGSKISNSAIFLIGTFGFFVVAVLAALALFVFGGRSVSTDNVELRIEGPTASPGGEVVPLAITIKNENPVMMTGVRLSVDFPNGAYDADDPTTPLPHYTETLDDLRPGETVTRTVRATFFGTENQKVDIPVTLEYRTEGTSATFVKRETYRFTLSSSPVSITVESLSEISSGQPVTFRVTVRSNATGPLENLAVRASYPAGFVPSSSSEGPLFPLEDLAPGEETELRITGTLSGQDKDERVFKFTAGTAKGGTSEELALPYITDEVTILIAKPFLALSLATNGSTANTIVVGAGESVQNALSWENSLPTAIQDGEITVTLRGDALDEESVKVSGGFYRSADGTIIFDRDTNQGLRTLQAGDTGSGSFSFRTVSGSALEGLRSPTITLTVSFSGRRLGESRVPEAVNATLTRIIKVESDIALSMRAVRSVGPFENTGPWPPEVDEETTYTILLRAENAVNSIAGARVTVPLPSYMEFAGLAQPSGAVTFNETSSEVVWEIGDLAGGAEREAAFQVALTPSSSQEGEAPDLTGTARLEAYDRFAETDVSATASEVSTRTTTDPDYDFSYGTVQP